jgi:hypothetical protein
MLHEDESIAVPPQLPRTGPLNKHGADRRVCLGVYNGCQAVAVYWSGMPLFQSETHGM